MCVMLWLFWKRPILVSSCTCYFLATLPDITSVSVCLSSSLTNGSGISRWLFLLFWKMAGEGAGGGKQEGAMGGKRDREAEIALNSATHTHTHYHVFRLWCYILWLPFQATAVSGLAFSYKNTTGNSALALDAVTVFLAFSESFNLRLSEEATIADYWLSDVQKKWGWADFYCPSSSQRRGWKKS